MIKLNYHKIIVNGREIYYAKYRKNRHLRITVKSDKQIYITCPYLTTENEIIKFALKSEDFIQKALSSLDKKTEIVNEKLTRAQLNALKSKIDYFIKKYEILMNTNVEKWSIRNMKTLWGSCTSVNKTIRFNARLYYMSDDFIEYVVVHEMTHIFVRNHSATFYKMVEKYIPQYKIIQKESKKVRLS